MKEVTNNRDDGCRNIDVLVSVPLTLFCIAMAVAVTIVAKEDHDDVNDDPVDEGIISIHKGSILTSEKKKITLTPAL